MPGFDHQVAVPKHQPRQQHTGRGGRRPWSLRVLGGPWRDDHSVAQTGAGEAWPGPPFPGLCIVRNQKTRHHTPIAQNNLVGSCKLTVANCSGSVQIIAPVTWHPQSGHANRSPIPGEGQFLFHKKYPASCDPPPPEALQMAELPKNIPRIKDSVAPLVVGGPILVWAQSGSAPQRTRGEG